MQYYKRRIKQIDLKVTDACNLSCMMCGQTNSRSNCFLRFDKIQKFVRDIPQGISVYIWGGEPLLHPEIQNIIDLFLEKNANISINTNGLLLDQYIDYLKAVPLKSLIISLDGLNELHDKIRGKEGLFLAVERSLKQYIAETRQMKQKRFITVNFTIIPENYMIMKEFCEEIKSWDVNSITMNFPIIIDEHMGNELSEESLKQCKVRLESWNGFNRKYYGMDYNKFAEICKYLINKHGYFIRWTNENLVLNEENLKLLYERPEVLLPSMMHNTLLGNSSSCKKIANALVIDSSGNVVICPDFPETVIGNIENDTFQDFNNLNKYSLLNLDKECKAICYRCPHRN